MTISETIQAAENSVSNYLREHGPIVSWDEDWFYNAYDNTRPIGSIWVVFRDAAQDALRRSQLAGLEGDPREDESLWRTP